jgi:hypothetical protein
MNAEENKLTERIRVKVFAGKLNPVWQAARVLCGLEYKYCEYCNLCGEKIIDQHYARHYMGGYGPVKLAYHEGCFETWKAEQLELDRIFKGIKL